MALVSAAPYLALLGEPDSTLKSYALSSLNQVVDQLWAEIANNITELEELYEDDSFDRKELAAFGHIESLLQFGRFRRRR